MTYEPASQVRSVIVGDLKLPPGGTAAQETAQVDPGEQVSMLIELNLLLKADRRLDQLTYIEQKRVELARALAAGPRVLLLDEWLSGLSPSELEDGISVVWGLAAKGMAVILVEHVMTAVRALCDRVMVMNAGVKIAEGPPDAVLRDAEVIRAYLGDDDARD